MKANNFLLFVLLSLTTGLSPCVALGQAEADPLLAWADGVVVRQSDYELELLRLPTAQRYSFATDSKRVAELIRRMLNVRILARKAEAQGLQNDPTLARTLRREIESFWAEAYLTDVAAAAQRRFDANLDVYERRAMELYKVDLASKWTEAGSTIVSHILFETGKRSDEEARELAASARARALAGEDFSTLARTLSDEPAAKRTNGRVIIGQRDRMDPIFVDAASKLEKPGDISMPVRASFGWHVIKLEARQPPRVVPYEEARPRILDGMRAEFVGAARNDAAAAARSDPSIKFDDEAIGKLVKPSPLGDPKGPAAGG